MSTATVIDTKPPQTTQAQTATFTFDQPGNREANRRETDGIDVPDADGDGGKGAGPQRDGGQRGHQGARRTKRRQIHDAVLPAGQRLT